MKPTIVAFMMLTGFLIAGTARGEQANQGRAPSCLVEVISSELLPVGPLFYHTVRATLRVTPADGPVVVTTVERAIPWQAPPPRQGQRLRLPCDSALLESSFRLF